MDELIKELDKAGFIFNEQDLKEILPIIFNYYNIPVPLSEEKDD